MILKILQFCLISAASSIFGPECSYLITDVEIKYLVIRSAGKCGDYLVLKQELKELLYETTLSSLGSQNELMDLNFYRFDFGKYTIKDFVFDLVGNNDDVFVTLAFFPLNEINNPETLVIINDEQSQRCLGLDIQRFLVNNFSEYALILCDTRKKQLILLWCSTGEGGLL